MILMKEDFTMKFPSTTKRSKLKAFPLLFSHLLQESTTIQYAKRISNDHLLIQVSVSWSTHYSFEETEREHSPEEKEDYV